MSSQMVNRRTPRRECSPRAFPAARSPVEGDRRRQEEHEQDDHQRALLSASTLLPRPGQHRRELAGQHAVGGRQIAALQVAQRRAHAAGQAFDQVGAVQVGDRETLELPPQPRRPRRFGGTERTVDGAQRRPMAAVRVRRRSRVLLVTVPGHRRAIGHTRATAGARAAMVTPDG